MTMDRVSDQLRALLEGIRAVLQEQGTHQKALLEGIQNAVKEQDRLTKKMILLTKLIVVTAIITSIVGGYAIYLSYQTGIAINEMNNVTKKIFVTEHFKPQIHFVTSNSISLELRNYTNAQLVDKFTMTSISSDFLEIKATDIGFDPPISDFCAYPEPHQVRVDKSWVKFIDKGVSNLDIDLPFKIDFTVLHNKLTPPIMWHYPQLNGSELTMPQPGTVARLRVGIDVIDLQTNEIIKHDSLLTDMNFNQTYFETCPIDLNFSKLQLH